MKLNIIIDLVKAVRREKKVQMMQRMCFQQRVETKQGDYKVKMIAKPFQEKVFS